MCDLCSENLTERMKARNHAAHISDSLSDLSHDYLNLAGERIKPHSDQAALIRTRAVNLIRQLVEDWL